MKHLPKLLPLVSILTMLLACIGYSPARAEDLPAEWLTSSAEIQDELSPVSTTGLTVTGDTYKVIFGTENKEIRIWFQVC